ncbi:MAG TPA: helicase C-terminal domain-containing protein, partial [Verrucomicrobiae bacterium]|nr:helicase C-terminal domain-containing protein [Verrucomicrobiae bacterium]
MQARNYVVLDLETTGVQAGIDEIIEIGAVKILEGKLAGSFQTLVKPCRPVNLAIQRLTGISNSELEGQPGIIEVLPDLLEFIGDLPIAAHNAGFDRGFLTAALGRPFGVAWLDTLELARIAFPLAPNHRLSGLAQHLCLGGGVFHRALADAESAAQLLLRCLDKMGAWDLALVRQVGLLLRENSGGTADLIRQLEKDLTRKFPDRLIRESVICLAKEEMDTGLFARREEKQRAELPEAGEIARLLGPQGPFAAQTSNYRHRVGQLQMLERVIDAFATDDHLVVEAGTGTGKSLAYAVPAVWWAVAKQEKVVIATHTINLQEQLWEKDIPLLRKFLPVEFSAALVKGRGNYLCLRKWQGLWSDLDSLSHEVRHDVAQILTWLSETQSGDRAELNLAYRGQELWNRFAADSESCLGPRCRFCNRGCFVMRARRKAENADILIVNHSLLLSDIKTENKVLPAYNYVIIDEAHHLEDSATDHLGAEINASGLEHLCRALQRSGNPPGLLGHLKVRLPGLVGKLGEANYERLEQAVQEGQTVLTIVREGAKDFFDGLAALVRSHGSAEGGTMQFRLKKELAAHPDWPNLCVTRENLSIRLEQMADILKGINAGLEDPEDEDLAGLIRDVDSLGAQCRSIAATASELMDLSLENQVVWIELDERNCRLKSAPVEVGPLLREMLFDKVKAGVLTSATLAVNDSFEHFLARIGLDRRTTVLQVESPFHYEEQALLCIPRDLPDPVKADEQGYIGGISTLLVDLVRTVQGRTLVLFTSHKILREVHYQIKPYLEAEDIQVLGHNLDGNRGKLVEEFKANPRTVLLGASSFWEGVDIQGEALSCVVIVKLPFMPPTMPTVEARLEELARQKKDGFRHFSIPQAVIRLKQGFGRLIRTEADRGVVVILDNRVLDKSYGRKFLNSLPLKTH